MSLRRDEVWLSLSGVAVALLVPAGLPARVVPVLIRRHCPPLVFAHPAIPDHRVLLGAESYSVRLGHPTGMYRISTRVLLPPTVTDGGALSWVHPPQPDALRLTREIDLCGAIHAVAHDPPSKTPPSIADGGSG